MPARHPAWADGGAKGASVADGCHHSTNLGVVFGPVVDGCHHGTFWDWSLIGGATADADGGHLLRIGLGLNLRLNWVTSASITEPDPPSRWMPECTSSLPAFVTELLLMTISSVPVVEIPHQPIVSAAKSLISTEVHLLKWSPI